MMGHHTLGKRWVAVCLAALTALQPLTGYAQAIGEAIRNADKPLPHVLPIADRADMLPLPYVPPQWMKSSAAWESISKKLPPAMTMMTTRCRSSSRH